MTTPPPVSFLFQVGPPILPIDADSLVELNNALKFTPVEELRDLIRGVCFSNLEVAAVLHAALCGRGVSFDEDDEGEEGEDVISSSHEDVTPIEWTDDDGDDEEDEDEDEEEEEADDEEDQPSSNSVSKAAVIDLTGPDSDMENTVVEGKRKAARLFESSTAGQLPKKRKAAADSTIAKLSAIKTVNFKDRYKNCSNCNELFDLKGATCHPHKNGPKRTPGPRERMDGDEYGGSDESEDEDDGDDEIEDEDPCDCIYHSGYLYADHESDQWADHDERCHGSIDNDWTMREYPDGYIWSCCDQTGSADGCKMGKHEAFAEKSHLAKINASGGLKKRFRYTF